MFCRNLYNVTQPLSIWIWKLSCMLILQQEWCRYIVSKPLINASKTVQEYEQKHQIEACFSLFHLWDAWKLKFLHGIFVWYSWRLIKNPNSASDTQSLQLYWILKVFRSWKITPPANSMLYLSTNCLQENELATLSEIVSFGRCD